MVKKKIMLLGGIRYLLPVIEAAHKLGYYVITVDNVPDNIAHKYSDEYLNVSIVDRDAILEVAKVKRIDGIMSFGVDPGVETAAYVQEMMGLPSVGPYESVCILQNKDRFRSFLTENGFNVPKSYSYLSLEEVLNDIDEFAYPVIVKPTDSAGSKGVTKVCDKSEVEKAFVYAKQFSIKGRVIIEDFIEKRGCSSDSDCFSYKGNLVAVTYSAQRFDTTADNPYAPSAFSWPSTFSKKEESYLSKELQRLLFLLKMNTSIYNIETRIGLDGKPYIMEVSPRGGGNRLAEMVRYASGVDLITAAVKSSVGEDICDFPEISYDGCWAEIVLHSDRSGMFESLDIDSKYSDYVVETDLWVKKGEKVNSFKGANDSIGTLVMKFDSEDNMLSAFANQKDWLKVSVC